MLPDVVDGKPSMSTHLQRIVLAVVGLLTGRGASVTVDRLIQQWPKRFPMPHPKVLRRTLRRLAERQIVHQVAPSGYEVNRQLAAAAAARGARFRFVASDFDGTLSPLEIDVLALLRGMRSARGHSAGHLGELLGRDERSVRSAVHGRQRAQGEHSDPCAGLLAMGRLQVTGETRLRRGNRVPVLMVVDRPHAGETTVKLGNSSPGRGNSSPGRGNSSPDTLDSARPADSARLDHPPHAPGKPIENGAEAGADDPTSQQSNELQPARVVAMPTLAAIEADEAAGRAGLNGWSVWRRNLRQAVEVVQRPVSGDLAGYAAAWFAVLTLAGVFVPARRWRGRGPTTLRQHRRDLAERLAREQGHPDIGATWLYAMADRIEADGKPPSAIAAALVASVTPKDREQLAGTRNPVGVDLGQFVKPQGGDGAKNLPQQWIDDAMTAEDRAKADGSARLIAGAEGVQQLCEAGGEIAARKLKEKLAAEERARRLRDLSQQGDATHRRQVGRLVGAAIARDWRKLAAWMEGSAVDVVSIANASGVAIAEIEEGLAAAQPRRTTA